MSSSGNGETQMCSLKMSDGQVGDGHAVRLDVAAEQTAGVVERVEAVVDPCRPELHRRDAEVREPTEEVAEHERQAGLEHRPQVVERQLEVVLVRGITDAVALPHRGERLRVLVGHRARVVGGDDARLFDAAPVGLPRRVGR